MSIPGSLTPLFNSGGGAGYQISRSLRFNADSAYLSRTPASAGNRKTWTWAGWVKRSKLSTFTVLFEGAVDYNDQITRITFESNDKLAVLFYDGAAVVGRKTTDAVFRDCSAWYHILVAVDTTQATAGNRIRVYVNGSEVTSFSSTTNPSQNYDTYVNATNGHRINTETNSPGGFSDFYAADYHLIDGQALTPSSFTEVSATTGQLIPKAYTDVLPGPVTLVPSIAEGALIIKADAATITGSVTAAGFVKVHSSSDGINWTYREQILSGALSFSAKYIAIGGGSTNSRTFNPSTGGSYTWAEYSAGTQFDTTSNITQNVTGLSYTANSTVTAPFGTNGFWLKFSDNSATTATTLGKDYSGNGNNWTPNNFSVGNSVVISSPVRFTWATAGTNWTLSNSDYTATYSGTTTYSALYSIALDGSTTYRFIHRQTAGDSVGGWFLKDSTGAVSTHPDELGGNSLGQRIGEDGIGTYGTFATANGTSSGQDQILGFSSITPTGTGATNYSEWVINMSVRKVWVRQAGSSTWIKGGDPSNTSSTPSFSLPSGTIYFGYVGYSSTGITSIDTSSPATNGKDIDSLVDTPTSYGTDTGAGGEVRGNYCTWNPLSAKNTSTVFSNGNLDLNTASTAAHGHCGATIAVSSGKWYWEITKNTNTAAVATGLGVGRTDVIPNPNSTWFGTGAGKNYVYLQGGTVFMYDGANSGSANSTSVTDDAGTFMFALDLDNGKFWVGKNGTWFSWNSVTGGNPSTGANPTFSSFTAGASYTPVVNTYEVGNTLSANFGQRPFAYTAPSGFKSLCDTNLPAPTIAKPSTVMDVALYTGNGTSKSVTGLNFSPEFVWIKSRSAATNNVLFDAVRGAAKVLYSDLTSAEVDRGNIIYDFTSFDSNGFTVGISNNAGVNTNNATYAAWCFDAGSNTVSNTQGSITSQVRANASAGFSIVTYTGNGTAGATIGHGLGVAPQFVICKRRDADEDWWVGHVSPGWTTGAYLQTTDAFSASSNFRWWNNTAPTSSVITLGTYPNTNTGTYVCYAFAPVAGYSSFGSYTGNNSTDGPFVYTGFSPRWILIKMADTLSTYPWEIYDTARSTYNVMNVTLSPNKSTSEPGQPYPGLIDVTANGFKIRSANNTSYINYSAATYIYAAFAENPFQYSRAR